MKRYVFLVLLIVHSLPMFAQQLARDTSQQKIEGIYSGMLGGRMIVLEIGYRNASDDLFGMDAKERSYYPIIGRYFYRVHGISILVEGAALEDRSVRLKEYYGSSFDETVGSVLTGNATYLKSTGGQWKLVFKHEKATGIFCRCDVTQPLTHHKRAIVSLVRVSNQFDPQFYSFGIGGGSPSCLPFSLSGISDGRYSTEMLQFPLEAESETETGQGIAYVKLRDRRFKVQSIKLIRFTNEDVMKRINEDLSRKFNVARMAAAAFEQGLSFEGGRWESTQTVASVDRNILKVILHASYALESANDPRGDYDCVLKYNMMTGARIRH